MGGIVTGRRREEGESQVREEGKSLQVVFTGDAILEIAEEVESG